MPQIFKPYTNPMDDKRRKIHPNLYPEIISIYNELKSTRKTATLFNCSRRLIMFIVHPERLKEIQRQHKEQQHWKKYFNREQLTKAARNWRHDKMASGLAFTSKGIPCKTRQQITANIKNPKLARYQREWRAKKKLQAILQKPKTPSKIKPKPKFENAYAKLA